MTGVGWVNRNKTGGVWVCVGGLVEEGKRSVLVCNSMAFLNMAMLFCV